ncbi:unnamed protein product [Prorocentrum cordatum]|uniref:Uncharacterized protein n=1 Tax=Prorocentrum cordatum TaxID=2364126 RepID=A0ABN9URC8_9DINO|nr:unnamed protein product [Polarella glacialis]
MEAMREEETKARMEIDQLESTIAQLEAGDTAMGRRGHGCLQAQQMAVALAQGKAAGKWQQELATMTAEIYHCRRLTAFQLKLAVEQARRIDFMMEQQQKMQQQFMHMMKLMTASQLGGDMAQMMATQLPQEVRAAMNVTQTRAAAMTPSATSAAASADPGVAPGPTQAQSSAADGPKVVQVTPRADHSLPPPDHAQAIQQLARPIVVSQLGMPSSPTRAAAGVIPTSPRMPGPMSLEPSMPVENGAMATQEAMPGPALSVTAP